MKNKNKNSQSTVNNKKIVNKRNPGKPTKKKPSVRSAPTTPAKLMNDFSKSLKQPFAPSTMGCRVPDLFSFPTATYHLHGTTVLATASGASSGAVMFLPNPFFSMVDIGTINGGTAALTTSMLPFSSNTSAYSATTTLNNVLTDFRVVSWGIKISNLQPEQTATGRIMIYTVPCADEVPTYDTLANIGMTSGYMLSVCGGDVSTLASASVLNFPSAFELATQDLLHGDLEIAGSYVSPRYFDFKNSNASYTSGANKFVDAVTVSSSGGIVSAGGSGFKDPTRMVGGCGIGIYFEGVPASTKAFQVEYIYHIEGSPLLTTTASSPVASNHTGVLVGNTAVVEASISATSGPNAFSWISKGADFLNDAFETGKKFLNSPLGSALSSAAWALL